MEKINIFISYSNKDKKFLEELKVYVNPVNCSNIKMWDDGDISISDNFDTVIKKNLQKADIVLLLISPNFLISKYIREIEQEIIFRKEAEENCKVIPIFIRTCFLDPYPAIKKLQGFPKGERPLLVMKTSTKDEEYKKLIHQINELAQKLMEEKIQVDKENNINNSINNGDVQSGNAKILFKLNNARDIFLSIPTTEEGWKKRSRFVRQVEGKIEREKWPYRIVPDLNQVAEIINESREEQKRVLISLIKKSIYSIHIFSEEAEALKGFEKDQYDWLEKDLGIVSRPFKSILWLSNESDRVKLTEDINKNPVTSGYNCEQIFEYIKSLDTEKERRINELSQTFSTRKKIYLCYDFKKDHDNDLRIKLKSKLEEREDFYITFSPPFSQTEKEKSDLAKCDAAIIFYGATDLYWFANKQSMVLGAKNLKTKAVCVDEPEIDKKIHRDIQNRDFGTTIKGEKELDPGVKHFIEGL